MLDLSVMARERRLTESILFRFTPAEVARLRRIPTRRRSSLTRVAVARVLDEIDRRVEAGESVEAVLDEVAPLAVVRDDAERPAA